MSDDASPTAAPVERFALRGPSGLALRAEWAGPDDPTAVVVLCHPHPLHGGNMYATVIDHLFRVLPDSGIAALRFNFRGVDGSDGRHDHGAGEQDDVRAAAAEAVRRVPGTAPVVVGWSFGADVALAVGGDALAGWCAVAAPLRVVAPTDMAAGSDRRPTLLLVPEHDQFRPPADAEAATEGWVATTRSLIAGGDHFLNGRLSVVTEAVEAFIATIPSSSH